VTPKQEEEGDGHKKEKREQMMYVGAEKDTNGGGHDRPHDWRLKFTPFFENTVHEILLLYPDNSLYHKKSNLSIAIEKEKRSKKW
jgi:hypothetical protein